MPGQFGFLSKVFNIMASNGISVRPACSLIVCPPLMPSKNARYHPLHVSMVKSPNTWHSVWSLDQRVMLVYTGPCIGVDCVATSEVSVSLTLDPAKLWDRDLVQEELDSLIQDFEVGTLTSSVFMCFCLFGCFSRAMVTFFSPVRTKMFTFNSCIVRSWGKGVPNRAGTSYQSSKPCLTCPWFEENGIARVKCTRGHSIISLIGNVDRNNEIMERTFRALRAHKIRITMIR